MTGTNCHKKL